MAGSTYGNRFKIMTWGESHGEALGVVVDGCPAGLELCEEDIQKLLDRRKPGQSKFTTPRKEADKVNILIHLMQNTDSGITAAAEEVPQEKRLAGSQRVRLR